MMQIAMAKGVAPRLPFGCPAFGVGFESPRVRGSARSSLRRGFHVALLVAVLWPLCPSALQAASDGWRIGTIEGAAVAGFWPGKSPAILWFRCMPSIPGRLQLLVDGLPAGLPRDVGYTVVVSVDGLAFVETGHPVAAAAPQLAVTAPPSTFAALIGALSNGTKAEVSTPSGRRVLSLKGSGKALSALPAACG